MDLIERPLGTEGSAKVIIQGGKIRLIAQYDSAGLDGKVELSADSDYFIDQIAAQIPGQIDDAIFAVLKNVLKSL